MKKNYLLSKHKSTLELFFSKKYILLLVALLLLLSESSSAQTAGPNNPASGTFIAGANVDWNTPGNITNTADTNYATAVFAAAGNTDNLQGSNYGFSIPGNAIVNGIVVTVNRRTSATNGGRITKDNLVSLVKGGVVTGNNKATATAYGTTFAVATYGSATDTWGTTWTPADINAANFGAVISVNANNSLTATIDYIRITIHYTVIGFTPSSGCVGSNTAVVITGNYIAGATAVNFNGTAATFVQNSSTQITATLPVGATTGTISLTTPQGTGTSSTNFTVNPLPVVDAITGNTTVCAGASTILSNSTLGGSWSSASPAVATVTTSGEVTGLIGGNTIISYTFTDSNGCSNSATTTVTVNAAPAVSAPNSVCVGGTIQLSPSNGGTWISNDITKATIDNTGLATGMDYGSVTFTFTDDVTTCSNTTTAVSVPQPMSISSQPAASQTICENSLVSLSVTASGDNLSYQWFKGATALANGGNISGVTTPTLTFNLSTPANSGSDYYCVISNGCDTDLNSDYAAVIVNEQSVGGTASISLPNVTPVVRTTTVCHFGSGSVYLSGHTGTIIRWESTTNGGATWTPIANTTTTLNYTNITQTTFFRAVVQNGASCNLAYSYIALIDVIPNIKPSPVTATPQTICIGGSSVLYSESGFATSSYLANGGTFSNANPDNWLVDGCGNCLNAGGSNTTEGPFRLSATNGGTYSGIDYASIGKFAIANGNYNSVMQTPIFNTFGLTSATLSFNHAFNLQAGASVSIELSLDGGTTYSIILASYTGPSTRSPYNAFPNQTIDLSNYIGQANLRVRFVYNGTVNSSWAIDNILIPETPSNLTTQWVDSITGQVISNTSSVSVTPTVTTTYAVTSYLNGCTSYGPDGTTYITVTVNPRPTANIGPDQTICLGNPATFSVALTGTAPWSITYSNGATTTTVNNITTNPYIFNVNGITANRTFTITALSDARCTAIASDISGSATVTVLNGTPGLWTGLVSTDWFDCKNWAGGMPSATIDAQIPAGAVRMPVIDPSTSSFAALYSNIARARDVIIANSASLTMSAASNSDLYVSRDWKNSGTFVTGIGTVTFNGATTNQIQNINVGIKTNETFYNLTLNTSNGAKGVSVVDNFQLTVSNNVLLLSGDLRFTGEAQLVQSGTAANPSSGTGKILIDQQGHKSSFHYNYWSSPVTTSGTNYTIGSVLKDGTDSAANPFNPSTINFGNGVYFADGALTFPIKISTSWMYKYTSIDTSYAGWQYVGTTGTINPGEGFTMKGPTGTPPFNVGQNYVFAGKPNNGNINLNIALNQSYLVGNPYPSALDAEEFIKDNIKDGPGRAASNIFNGSLYFWDHFGGQSHVLNQYIGGYSTFTLMGGVVAISNDPLINANGAQGTRAPKKYIPVGQGFFIGTGSNSAMMSNNPNLSTPVTGGTISFKNSQRAFKAKSSTQSIFFRNGEAVQTEEIEEDLRQKIRLQYQSPSQKFRQILVGADENTTDLFDIGYDAPIIDLNDEDLYWNNSDIKMTIQAVPDFNDDQILPLGIKTASEGLSTIKIETLENVAESTNIYIYDNQTGIYHDIRTTNFEISLPVGEYNDRFSVRFSTQSLGLNTAAENTPIIFFTNTDSSLNIKNKSETYTILSVSLFNLLGQKINTYSVNSSNQEYIKIPVENMAEGAYVVKVTTDSSKTFSQKIVKN
ncbi:T9SS type A sorting domain-containing protein [Flavobacterium sedimenticola]|uniref:T9SS type A sorting domain-containing protein n=1 Tax=Flavobacterium sedimenticola TaxID=3043286 RepID=A0ABT6XSG0_9FLAO|nr:T9SS type A sorting domain-containing protein [Flavobacterium sedimenticola]MDI9258042.1 T9SS type A sorting domain-containing protein [Flavobacterium sedimenticola]